MHSLCLYGYAWVNVSVLAVGNWAFWGSYALVVWLPLALGDLWTLMSFVVCLRWLGAWNFMCGCAAPTVVVLVGDDGA